MDVKELETKLEEMNTALEVAKTKAANAETTSKEAVTRAEKAEQTLSKVLTLNNEEQEVYKGLADADKIAFLEANAEVRKELIVKAKTLPDVPEVVTKQLTELSKKLEAQEARAASAEQRASVAEEKARFQELRKSAESDYAALPGTTEEKATTLKALDKLTEEERAGISKLLTAGNAAIAIQLKSIGKDNGGADGSDAWSQIEKKAKAYAIEHKIDLAEAQTRVLNAEPELYAKYKKEMSETTQ